MVDFSKLTIPNEDIFTNDEKITINLVLQYGTDRNSMIKEFSKIFRTSASESEGKYLFLQNKILSKISYSNKVDYLDFMAIVREIDKKLGC